MPDKHHYQTKPPTNMVPQRDGTPRNTGSPPPDLPPYSYSRPPETQSAKPQNAGQGSHAGPGVWTPQPGARPHERVKNPSLKGNGNGKR